MMFPPLINFFLLLLNQTNHLKSFLTFKYLHEYMSAPSSLIKRMTQISAALHHKSERIPNAYTPPRPCITAWVDPTSNGVNQKIIAM